MKASTVFLGTLVALVIIQFFRPEKNISARPSSNNIAAVHNVPAGVNTILGKACNDCHSNNTRYPWYSNIQPLGWWLSNHVKEGKDELNFDEFSKYSLRKQYHKLEELTEEVQEGHMPLSSYTFMHKDSKLGEAEKTALIDWADGLRAQMKAKYPPDSLVRKK